LTDLDLTDLDLTDLCETRQISASTAVLVGYPKSSLALRPTRNAVKAALVLIVFAVSAFALAIAQDQAAITGAEAACGPKTVKFSAVQDATQHPTPQPETGKALVYLVQDIGEIHCSGCALTKAGLDGSWVGANQGSSYFFFAVAPGEHHLCVNWQSVLDVRSRAFAMLNFTAEEGKTYYFRERFIFQKTEYSFTLEPTNSDEGKYLVASSVFSVSHPKTK
jgi:hypothetical protein